MSPVPGPFHTYVTHTCLQYSTALGPGPLLGGAAAGRERESEAEIGSKYEEADQKPVLAPLRSPAGPQACKPLAVG